MDKGSADFIVQLLPMFLVQLILLFAVVPLASAYSKWRWVWIVFSVFPGLGALVFPLLLGKGVAALLRRIEELSSKIDANK